MKRLPFLLFLIPTLVMAQEVDFTATLNAPEAMSAPSGTTLYVREVIIRPYRDEIRVVYRFLNPDGLPIPKSNGRIDRQVFIRNTADNLFTDVNGCSGVSIPWSPCSGVSTETPSGALDESDPAYSDVMGFMIRSQDVGKKVGKSLRTLIWSKIKGMILTGGNDGTFSN